MHIPAQSKLKSVRTLVASALLGLTTLGGISTAVAADDEVVMYKDPNCGCCGKWAEHMREHGFKVKEVATTQMGQVKGEAGVPQALGSCHTARVGGYVVEGHVPAAGRRRMLAQKPALAGISGPAPARGAPRPGRPYPADRYDVVSFDAQGRTAVYASH